MRTPILICLMMILSSCEGLKKTDDVPGSDLPELTVTQQAQTRSAVGPLGDIINYIEVMDQGSKNDRKVQNRKTQRNALKASIPIENCSLVQSGNKKTKFYFSMKGSSCAVRIKSDREKIQSGDINGDYVVSESFHKDFVANNQLVSSEIADLTMRGDEESSVKSNGDTYTLKRELEAATDVRSKSKGSYTYKVSMQSERVVNFSDSSKKSEISSRTDTVSFSNFKVVIYKKITMVDGSAVENDHYVNGVRISEAEYQFFMQDLDVQMNYGNSSNIKK